MTDERDPFDPEIRQPELDVSKPDPIPEGKPAETLDPPRTDRVWNADSLWPADIMLTRGNGMVNKLIRRFSPHPSESVVEADHTGIFDRAWPRPDRARVLEATATVVKWRPLRESSTLIIRASNINWEQRVAIAARAAEFAGRPYGYAKLALQGLDYLAGGRYLFRRIAHMEEYPICSYHVAMAYREEGLDFGVPARGANPHDIHWFANKKGSPYRTVGVWGDWDRTPPSWSGD